MLSTAKLILSSARLVLLIAAAGAVPALAAAPALGDPAKGQQLATPCLACHSADGSRGPLPTNPILQGQHPSYLAKQLAEFKAGKRKNPIMNGMAAPLSDDDMRHLAAFFGAKKPVTGEARNKATLALGERIYRGGIAAKGVPACAGCHSPDGAGIPAQYPRLGGQHPEYLEAQMLGFRGGERTNSAPMLAIAGRMNDAEIKAVVDYIAGLR